MKPFCIINKQDHVTYVTGKIQSLDFIQELENIKGSWPVESISMIPFSQIRERGFMAHHDNERIITIVPETYEEMSKEAFLQQYARHKSLSLDGEISSNLSDLEFEDIVKTVINDEIKNGEGSNFLLSRKTFGTIKNFDLDSAFTILTSFMNNEFGSYMNFMFFDGEKYFIGASPEMHILIDHNSVTVNPICGTLPKAGQGDFKERLDEFLQDPKEINELFQVVDETMKIMTKICQDGGVIKGPFLKEMRTLIHTHYELEGTSTLRHLNIFTRSMYAPTMVGSPLENAARVIYKYETDSRRYYSSVILLKGRNKKHEHFLDSGITIRTIEIGADGSFTIQSGASIVRDSKPEKERIEVTTKALGAIKAITQPEDSKPILDELMDENIMQTLMKRNDNLSTFWLQRQEFEERVESLRLRSILVIDNEDEFSFMLAHVLRSIGFHVRVDNSENISTNLTTITEDLIILGPGPGDPRNIEDHRIGHINKIGENLLASDRPFLGVCLGHQVITRLLGFQINKLAIPLQGVQIEIDFFGRPEKVGFYNTFIAAQTEESDSSLELAKNEKNHVYATRHPRFSTFQFHVESVLTRNSVTLVFDEIKRIDKNLYG